eukprot:366465-Chlamydomonas_euryale.AAC.10
MCRAVRAERTTCVEVGLGNNERRSALLGRWRALRPHACHLPGCSLWYACCGRCCGGLCACQGKSQEDVLCKTLAHAAGHKAVAGSCLCNMPSLHGKHHGASHVGML